MNNKLYFTLTLTLYFSLFANIRGPHIFLYNNSENMHFVNSSLAVESEILNFTLPDIVDYSDYKIENRFEQYAYIEAVYNISSESDNIYSFEFIMPDSVITEIYINDKKADNIINKVYNPYADYTREDNGDTELFYKDKNYEDKISDTEKTNSDTIERKINYRDHFTVKHNGYLKNWSGGTIEKMYKAKFYGKMIKGKNKIVIRYKQPANIIEEDHGYFISSEYSTSVGYEIWPIKEWKKTDDFSIEVNIKLKDDASFFTKLFRGFYDIKMTKDFLKKKPEKPHEYKLTDVDEKDMVFKRIYLKHPLPERIYIIWGEDDHIDCYEE